MTEIRYKIVYMTRQYPDTNNPSDYIDTFHSFWAEDLADVIYTPGQFVEAPQWLADKGYHLCVYEDQKFTDAWVCGFYVQLWECECEDEISPLPMGMDVSELNRGFMIPMMGDWPQGTRMYKRVKLTRRLK